MSCRHCKGSSKVHIWPNTCRNWWFSWCLRIKSMLTPHLSWTVSLMTSATATKWVSNRMWPSTCSTSWSALKKAWTKFLQIWTSMYVYLNTWKEAIHMRTAIHTSQFWILQSQPWSMRVWKWQKKKELLVYRKILSLQMTQATQKSTIVSFNMRSPWRSNLSFKNSCQSTKTQSMKTCSAQT